MEADLCHVIFGTGQKRENITNKPLSYQFSYFHLEPGYFMQLYFVCFYVAHISQYKIYSSARNKLLYEKSVVGLTLPET
jgi:hypothetical protein